MRTVTVPTEGIDPAIVEVVRLLADTPAMRATVDAWPLDDDTAPWWPDGDGGMEVLHVHLAPGRYFPAAIRMDVASAFGGGDVRYRATFTAGTPAVVIAGAALAALEEPFK